MACLQGEYIYHPPRPRPRLPAEVTPVRFRFLVTKIGRRKFSVLSLDSASGTPRQYTVQFNGFRNADDPNFACKHVVAVMSLVGVPAVVEKSEGRVVPVFGLNGRDGGGAEGVNYYYNYV